MSTPSDSARPQITIFRGWKDYGKHVWSPFVVKLEARLRFAGVEYLVDEGSPKTAPKGKIPYVEYANTSDGGDMAQLSDSTLIIKTLSEWHVIPGINAALSPAMRAQDMALRALLEDKLYFYHTWERWTQNYYAMRDHVLQALPWPIRVLVGMIIYRKTVAMLHGQGTGRYTREEIAAFRGEIWSGINDLLVASCSGSGSSLGSEKKPFWVLGGEHPTEADTTLFGFIVSVLLSTAAPDSQRVVRGFPVIMDYTERIHSMYFPDYEKWNV